MSVILYHFKYPSILYCNPLSVHPLWKHSPGLETERNKQQNPALACHTPHQFWNKTGKWQNKTRCNLLQLWISALFMSQYFAAKVTAISHVRFGKTTNLKHQTDLPSKAKQLDLWPYPRHGNYHGRRKSTFDLVAVDEGQAVAGDMARLKHHKPETSWNQFG